MTATCFSFQQTIIRLLVRCYEHPDDGLLKADT